MAGLIQAHKNNRVCRLPRAGKNSIINRTSGWSVDSFNGRREFVLQVEKFPTLGLAKQY